MSTEIWNRLAAPFAFEDIKVMPQSTSKDMSKALAVAYFDARAVMNRLDDVLTPAGWKAEYREVKVSEKVLGIVCRLTVYVDGNEIVREDGCDPSDIEGFKGAISGSLKRAFSALGNRSLYDTDLGWQPIDTYEGNAGKKFKGWSAQAMKDMKARYERQCGKPVHAEAPKAPAAPSAQPADRTTASAAATGGTPDTDPDRHRKAVFATLTKKGIDYSGSDAKRAVLTFLSKAHGAPPDGFKSSTELTPDQWQERRRKLEAWDEGKAKISALDEYLAQQPAMSI